MADNNEPMSDEQLAEIRRRTLGGSGVYPAGTDMQMVFDRHRLLAEVERSRAREAAAMEIVRDVVAYATLKRYMDDCEWCGQIGQSVDAHASNCPVTKAHALLDQEKSPLLTPFAQQLQEWLWTGRGYGEPAWSRHQLAQELDVPDDTVEAWFVPDIPGSAQRPSYPEPRVFWRLQRLTGWKRDLMALLCGYSELPPQEE